MAHTEIRSIGREPIFDILAIYLTPPTTRCSGV
jgi:hypothetical protein